MAGSWAIRDERRCEKKQEGCPRAWEARRGKVCVHRASLAASQGRLKGAIQSRKSVLIGCLPGLAPFGAVFDDPIRKRPFEADIVSGFFRLDPLVLENLFALSLKLAVKRGILQHITGRKLFFVVRHIPKSQIPFVRGT